MSNLVLDKKIKSYIHMAIKEELSQLFADPDAGFKMKASFVKKLRSARGERSVESVEVLKRFKK